MGRAPARPEAGIALILTHGSSGLSQPGPPIQKLPSRANVSIRTAPSALFTLRGAPNPQAADHQEQALALFLEMGDQHGEACALNRSETTGIPGARVASVDRLRSRPRATDTPTRNPVHATVLCG